MGWIPYQWHWGVIPRNGLPRTLFWIITNVAIEICHTYIFKGIERIPYTPKFNSSPLKSYRNPKGKDRLPLPPFFRVELLNFGGVYFNQRVIYNQVASASGSAIRTSLLVRINPKNQQQVHSLKLTWHLKMDGWNTIVSFSDGLFSGAFAVSFREGISFITYGF